MINKKQGEMMRTKQIFILIMYAAPLWAEKFSFGQEKQQLYLSKFLSYLPNFRKAPTTDIVLPQNNTTQNNKIWKEELEKLNTYLNTITAKRPQLARTPSKTEIVQELQNELASFSQDIWQTVYTKNIVDSQLFDKLKETIGNAPQFASNAAHTKFFLIDVPRQLRINFSNTDQTYREQKESLLEQFNVINNEMIQGQLKDGSPLDKITQELTSQLTQAITVQNIAAIITLCEKFVENITALAKIIKDQNIETATKNSALKTIKDSLLILFNNANISDPKSINDYCFLNIKNSLYQYILNTIDDFNLQGLNQKAETIRTSITTALQQYKLKTQSNKNQSANFDKNVLNAWNKIFAQIHNKTTALCIFIIKNSEFHSPAFYKEKMKYITNQISDVIKTLRETRIALDTKNLQPTHAETLSYGFVDDYLNKLDKYQPTAFLYIKLVSEQNQLSSLHNKTALLGEIQTFITSYLGQETIIKATPSEKITSQMLYNYVIAQSIARYASTTIQKIITLYRQHFDGNQQIKIIQDYLAKLDTYTRNKINFGSN